MGNVIGPLLAPAELETLHVADGVICRSIRPIMPASSCSLRPESGPEAADTGNVGVDVAHMPNPCLSAFTCGTMFSEHQ